MHHDQRLSHRMRSQDVEFSRFQYKLSRREAFRLVWFNNKNSGTPFHSSVQMGRPGSSVAEKSRAAAERALILHCFDLGGVDSKKGVLTRQNAAKRLRVSGFAELVRLDQQFALDPC